MVTSTSRVGQRVDRLRVRPSKDQMYRANKTPVLTKTKKGQIIEKAVERYTIMCPDCDRAAYYDHDAEPICPECGLICGGRQGKEISQDALLVRDGKAAGRVKTDSS